jgi:hypothetical protein
MKEKIERYQLTIRQLKNDKEVLKTEIQSVVQ